MSVSKDFMDELRSRITLSDIIGKQVKLTRAGREFKACCPFHKEKTASFTVNDDKGFYHCFGCGAHGDVLKFVMDYQNLSFGEALEHLAGVAGLQLPMYDKAEEAKYEKQSVLYKIMSEANEYYKQRIQDRENKNIVRYLTDRGFSSSEILNFEIGFADFSGEGLKSKLLKSGFKEKDILDTGLFKRSQQNQGDYYHFFRNRIIFPVRDIRNRVVAFGGRVVPENYGGKFNSTAPKYINSPENEIFHKGKILYGLNNSIKTIANGDNVIVVEGYVDVIALNKAGFKSAVAPLGTALTESQIEEIWKRMPDGNRIPTLCFDGDGAGQRAASRALARVLPILKPDTSVKFAFLPDGYDPDTLIRKEGSSAMKKVLDNSLSLFEMMWQEESKNRDLSQPEARAGLKSAMIKRVSEITDVDIKKFFLDEINQKISEFSSSKTLNNHYYKTDYKKVKTGIIDTAIRRGALNRPVNKSVKGNMEKILFALIINHPWLYEECGEEFGMVDVGDIDYRKLKEDIVSILMLNHETDSEALKNELFIKGYSQILESIFNNSSKLLPKYVDVNTDFDTVREGWSEIMELGFRNPKKY